MLPAFLSIFSIRTVFTYVARAVSSVFYPDGTLIERPEWFAEKATRDTESTRASEHSPREQNSVDGPPYVALPPRPVNWNALRKLAHRASDVELVKRYAQTIGLGIQDEECLRLLVRTIKMLRACDYDINDIVMVMACASLQVKAVYPFLANAGKMEPVEFVSIAIVQIYISHSMLIDESCNLVHWQKWIFKSLADLEALNKAVIKLLCLHQYKLVVDPTEADKQFSYLSRGYSIP